MRDLSHLNPEQRRAVETTEGPLLVLAGAGSGKTRVVVHRIAWLLDLGVPPEAVLAVTFTNKAAAEMRERVAGETRKDVAERLTVSTFHAFGANILRRHIERMGYGPRFAIFDTQDQTAVIKRLLGQISLGRNFDVKRLLAGISKAKNKGLDPAAYMVRAKEDDPYEVILSEVYPRYQRALKAANAVDFDDLILMPLVMFAKHPDVLAEYQERYRYFMVDEYQDTSRVQMQLLKVLSEASGNVCVVGDDDQSIYAWRGAEVDNILKFERTFPGAQEIKLTRNYRSTGSILGCANAVIAKNGARRGKDLWTDAGNGEPVAVVIAPDDEEEARWVVEELERLERTSRLNHEDFAILFRTNGQARPIEEALRARSIDHKIVGGTRFFDRKEVRDGLSYLRVCHNPADDLSLARIVNWPSRGIGDTTLERLGEAARSRKQALFETMSKSATLEGLDRAEGAIAEFVDLIERYRRQFTGGAGLAETAREMFTEVGLFDAVRASVKSATAADARVAQLEALVTSLASYEKREARPSLAQYLARVALDGRQDDDEDKDRGKVTLLTLHAAKGLEFPVVFLIGLEEGLLPHSGMQGEAQNLPEERRLAYVGITRARRRLYMTRAAARMKRGKQVPTIPSRFLEDLPPDLVRIVDLSAGGTVPEDDVEDGIAFFEQMRAMLGGGS